MLLKYSKNTFVRQFGRFTYILDRIQSADQMFADAEVFFKAIRRQPRGKDEILKEICSAFMDVDVAEIAADFDDLIAPLIQKRMLLCGETSEELEQKEQSFSYDIEDPKTSEDRKTLTKQEIDYLPQTVLGEYFEQHPMLYQLQMDITQSCTERCLHCYIPEYNPVFLPIAKIKEVLDDFAAMGGLVITLSGGECMLHPDFDEIVRYAREKDLIVTILSNLTLCDGAKIQLLKENEVSVQVSLYSMNAEVHDGITRRPGSWTKTKTAIESLRAAQIPCTIACPTMKQNYHDYLDVLNFARSLKMHAITDCIILGKMNGDTSNLACRLDLDETRTILEDIVFRAVPMKSEFFSPGKKAEMQNDEEWMNDKVCGAGFSSLCLSADGNYYPCAAWGGYVIGNCNENSLKEIWETSPALLKLRNVRGRDLPKCAHCKDRDYCSVCMCRNFNETGDMFEPAEHFCKVAQINHELVDERQRRKCGNESV
jgi:radical SAM protein with 4Fe4S-binding SPASM domain